MIFDSPLNEAHRLDRAAESHLRFKRFDECLECHVKAKLKLTEVLSLTSNPQAIESLEAQLSNNIRQQRITKMKKEDYILKLKKKEEKEKEVPIHIYKRDILNNCTLPSPTLNKDIYRNIEASESLLQLLKGDGKSKMGSSNSSGSSLSDDQSSQSRSHSEGSKLPKDPLHVIEELKTVNHELRVVVKRLLRQNEEKTLENERNQITILSLESQLERYKSLEPKAHRDKSRRTPVHGMTDSVEDRYSPYVSPSRELSLEMAADDQDHSFEYHTVRTLPTLPPLEMPNFDYSLLTKRN